MREFRITEALLDELAELNAETADEARRKDEIVELVKTQELVLVAHAGVYVLAPVPTPPNL